MAIAFEGAADLNGVNFSTSYSVNYTCSSNPNRLLIVSFIGDISSGNDDITSVTYNGVSMILGASSPSICGDSSSNRFHYVYYLLNPATGTNVVAITWTNVHFIGVVAADYSGISQVGQPDNVTTHTSALGSATSLTTSLTTVANNCWIILGEASYEGGTSPTSGAGSTLRVTGVLTTAGEPSIFDSNGPITPAGLTSISTNSASNTGNGIDHIMLSFSPSGGSVIDGLEWMLRTEAKKGPATKMIGY